MARFTDTTTLREHLGDLDRNTAEGLLEGKLLAHEVIVERYARRRFCPAAGDPVQTKTFTTRGRTLVRVPDLREVTSISLGGLPLAALTDYDLGDHWPDTPCIMIDIGFGRRGSLIPLARDLSITGKWGWKPTPPDVCEAVYMLAARSYRKRDAGYSDTVALEGGSLSVYVAGVPEAQHILDAYRPLQIAVV